MHGLFMVLLQPYVLKNISLLISKKFIFSKMSTYIFLATFSVASPLLTLEPQNLFNRGMAYLCSYYNLCDGERGGSGKMHWFEAQTFSIVVVFGLWDFNV